ncbi:DUF1343 domain-containing protein [Paludicola sp. MB14-C6]|uniref:exo-beta-N-acetylmuramidase NamZ family protein n=1 Tax=Paludihabitans sp. MB14-C6 TaxID=3070656 RepID=UPI0027DE6EBD|nr:DUF1343 domain-containing protein [Paludicola sp. MB14-C6]WMJ24384.1 DUF1343 domain-containing protein [Paludicola sp. MB14-C6]
MKQKLMCGIDNLDQVKEILTNKRIGLITNPTGVNKSLQSTIDILHMEYNLACMFSPEHGVRGDLQAGDKVESYDDPKTNLPVYSLYGHTPHISDEILDTIDVMIFDIQDVGARFYTYLYTLAYAMEDCARVGKPLVVLDRPNPIGGAKIEGTVLDPAFKSFVGRFPIATRYGLTMGEYAQYINKEQNINANLHIVKINGYDRTKYYDETDLVWISPSPNLPTIDSCIAYIGTCLFEGTNVSEGRGTTKPFETIGAPWMNAQKVIEMVNGYGLKGFLLRETYFKPTFSKHQDQLCCGVQIHIINRDGFEPFKLGVVLVNSIRKLHSEFEFLAPLKEGANPFIDLLLGTDSIRKDNFDPIAFFAEQEEKCKTYQESIQPYLLY